MQALQSEIIKRFMSDKNFEMFLQQYKDARKHGYRSRAVTPEDRKILKDWKAGMTYTELKEKYHLTHARIQTSIVLATRE